MEREHYKEQLDELRGQIQTMSDLLQKQNEELDMRRGFSAIDDSKARLDEYGEEEQEDSMYDPEDERKPNLEDSKLSIDLDQIECWQDGVKRDYDKKVEELEIQMQSELAAIKQEYEVRIEELHAELQHEKEKRAMSDDLSVQYQTKFKQQEKLSKESFEEAGVLMNRIKTLEMQISSQDGEANVQKISILETPIPEVAKDQVIGAAQEQVSSSNESYQNVDVAEKIDTELVAEKRGSQLANQIFESAEEFDILTELKAEIAVQDGPTDDWDESYE